MFVLDENFVLLTIYLHPMICAMYYSGFFNTFFYIYSLYKYFNHVV